MTIITRNLLTRMAKSVKGDMKHTQKLDAFAAVLGYPDQTAMMGDLKTKEEAIAAAAKAASSFAQNKPAEKDLDDMIRKTLAAWLAQQDGSDLDPFPRSDWRQDVDNGDTQQGYEDWREAQVEQYLTECALESLLEAYASGITKNGVYLGPEGPLDYSLSHAVDRFRSVGGEAVFGDEAMEILEEILEEVESGSEESFTKRDQYRRNDVSRFRARVKEAWDERDNDLSEEISLAGCLSRDDEVTAFFEHVNRNFQEPTTDEQITEILQDFFHRTEGGPNDPFPRQEWASAVNGGAMSRLAYSEWRLSRSRDFLSHCVLDNLWDSYYRHSKKDGIVMHGPDTLMESVQSTITHYLLIDADAIFGKEFLEILESIRAQAIKNGYKPDEERLADANRMAEIIREAWLRLRSA